MGFSKLFHHELCGKTAIYNSGMCHKCKDILIERYAKKIEYLETKLENYKLKDNKIKKDSVKKRV